MSETFQLSQSSSGAKRSLRVAARRFGPWTVVAIAVADLIRRYAIKAGWMAVGPISPLAPSTALVFALLGVALGVEIWRPERRGWSKAALILCVIAFFLVLHVSISAVSGKTPRWEYWFSGVSVVVDVGAGPGIPHMTGQTAAFFLVSIFCLFAVYSPLARRAVIRDVGIIAALFVELFALVSVMSYAAGNPPLRPGGLIEMGPLVMAEFALFHGLLLFGPIASERIREWFFGRAGNSSDPAPISAEERRVLRMAAFIAVIAVISSVIYLRIETGRQQARILDVLQTNAELKVREVEQWRRERYADARTITHVAFLTDVARDPSAALARRQLSEWLRAFVPNYGYLGVTVFNAAHQPIVAEPADSKLAAAGLDEALRSLRDGAQIVELPLYLDAAGTLHWDLLVPLFDPNAGGVVGAVWLQTDPARFIIPLLQAWPAEYGTGQSSLWARQGNEFVALGGTRLGPTASAADRRIFGTKRNLSELPSESLPARILRGELQSGEGTDFRGVPILGMITPVLGTTWNMTTRLDSAEAYAPLRQRALVVAGIVASLLAITGITLGWLGRQRQNLALQEQLRAELEQKKLAARLGAVMQNAKDSIFVINQSHRIIEVNEQAARTYGWSREELLQMTPPDFRAPEVRRGFAEALAQANTAEGAVYETIHCRKDGSNFPVEISMRCFDVDGEQLSLSIVRDISDRKRAEAELRASEERYRLIAENTSDVIWLYDLASDQFTYVSPSVRSLLGYDPGEVRGQKLFTFMAPDSIEAARRVMAELTASAAPSDGGRHVTIELNHLRKDGCLVPTEVVASVLRDSDGRVTHLLGITRDITERRRARKALEKFNTELEERVEQRTAELATRNHEIQALVDSIPDTVLLCDAQGMLLSTQLPRHRATSTPFLLAAGNGDASHHPIVMDIVREMHAVVREGATSAVREFDRSMNGRDVSLEARIAPAGESRRLILLRDITARKRLERHVLANLDREKNLSEMKSQFISVASHEFRTPLAAAVGSLELLERHAAKINEAKRAELLSRIQRSLGRLTEIMNDVLQLSRADSGRITITRMHVDLVRLAQDILRDIEIGDRQQHRFTFEATGGPDTVPVDTKLTHHILSNLVSNAVRYSPAGTTVTVKLHIGEASFTLTVADEGIGVPEGERDRIFEPFARGSNVGQINGTGLGLNIVKRYTELMGGTIALLPTLPGATFRVVIPLSQPGT